MTDYDIPDDLIELKIAFKAAGRRVEELSARFPKNFDDSGTFVLGTAPPEAVSAWLDAHAAQTRTAARLYAHPWWDTEAVAANRYTADLAVNAAVAARSADGT